MGNLLEGTWVSDWISCSESDVEQCNVSLCAESLWGFDIGTTREYGNTQTTAVFSHHLSIQPPDFT